VWDFFYEHCSYFAPQSMTRALGRAGFDIRSIAHTFGGQYLWIEAAATGSAESPWTGPGLVSHLANPEWEQKFLTPLWERVSDLASKQKLAIGGAGAKGVTLANLLDPHADLFVCVADINPKKQGLHVAGTGHPIVSYSELAMLGVEVCLLMNPNYAMETLQLLEGLVERIELLDIMGKGTQA
jgi:hypothetical protein